MTRSGARVLCSGRCSYSSTVSGSAGTYGPSQPKPPVSGSGPASRSGCRGGLPARLLAPELAAQRSPCSVRGVTTRAAVDLGPAIRISGILEAITTPPPCGRPAPGSAEESASLVTTYSCRRGQGGRPGCEFCSGERARKEAANVRVSPAPAP